LIDCKKNLYIVGTHGLLLVEMLVNIDKLIRCDIEKILDIDIVQQNDISRNFLVV